MFAFISLIKDGFSKVRAGRKESNVLPALHPSIAMFGNRVLRVERVPQSHLFDWAGGLAKVSKWRSYCILDTFAVFCVFDSAEHCSTDRYAWW